jgi:hypothetical protein
MEAKMSKRNSVWGTLAGLAVAGGAALATYLVAVRPWHRRWGATDAELKEPLPGDELVAQANFETTRAIDIDAAPEAVWPWLVQLGQGRGGFYSYDKLENMMGLDIQSSGDIAPEFQDLQVGDVIPLEPEGGGYTVVQIEPNQHLLLFTEGGGESELDEVFRQAGAASTWVFVLRELPDGGTRLVVRWRARWDLFTTPLSFSIGLVLDPIEFMMEQKMMKGIKERAEGKTQ